MSRPIKSQVVRCSKPEKEEQMEILSQIHVDEHVLPEIVTTCIYYKDGEKKIIRQSPPCRSHPELMENIRDNGNRTGPEYT